MHPNLLNRRTFLRDTGVGIGATALAGLLARDAAASASPSAGGAALLGGLPGLPHFAPKAKRVIFLCMAGGPSHLESFDNKPKLTELSGQPMPESITAGQPIAQLQGTELIAHGAMTRFKRYGQSGLEVSDFFPHTARLADDITVIKSMVTEQINHDPAHTFMNTGTAISGRPSMGSWVNYGLGSECDNLPGFVVLMSHSGRNPQPLSSRQWSAGFLPGRHQGVPFNATGDVVHYVGNPPGVDRQSQRRLIDRVTQLDAHRNQQTANPAIDSRIAAYELAFRMQASVPTLADCSDEPRSVLEKYGATPGDGTFASNCLLARRLAERGVRFIQLYHKGWDHHGGLKNNMTISAGSTDRPCWALVDDLKSRGLLDDTLVIWGGEFGRTPMVQNKGSEGIGRDHHIKGFTMWMAGGGVKPGVSYGATDDFGYHATENPVHVRDLHATMLALLGVDHARFAVKHQGLDLKLTGVEPARVVREVLA
ncbi:hypothetical protein Pla123a_14420 [Posidoniimonas polymericola]|uniref:Sulfatase n=1 Tax=Posidoniimonas polymericola TaxID=2528002 RepID=A0A5C5YS18_9BACT|nr:DUF1501 domain-containing protein [Posidoniimonas polymericola]TWT77646.1 hypothetical protein Pla123a_14420 [Posidoniimonas polymericola]